MKRKQGYRIADYEQALPAGAAIDEVVYKSNGGLNVDYVKGTVREAPAKAGSEGRLQPGTGGHAESSSMVGLQTRMVTWDDEGLCYNRRSGTRMPEWDLPLKGGRP